MSGVNRGKQFEEKFKADFMKLDGVSLDRLYDSTSGFRGIKNISDFICYKFPNEFYIECKSCNENTWNFSNYTQYEKQLVKVGIPGVRVGVVLWMIKHDVVVYIPTKTIQSMKANNKKSFNIKDLENNIYRIIKIPSVKRRVFLDSDYSVLFDLQEGD